MGDIRTEAGGEMPETRHEHVRRRNKIIFSTLAITIIIVTLGFVIKVPHKATAVGYITTAEYADVRASTAGRVAEILISSGDTVKKGDAMVKLESDTEKAAVEEAEKLVNKAEAELALRKATATENKRAHTEAIKLAELELKYAKEQLEVTKSRAENEALRLSSLKAELEGLGKESELYDNERKAIINKMLKNGDRREIAICPLDGVDF
jgi:multidrug efflux pump subunit AcrA (membrane-fusion protein)